jgi:predicted metalloprotease with PDZ domain
MSVAPRLGGALLALVSLLVGARTAQANVTYILHIDHPDQHLFRVQMIVPMPEQDIVVALPAWNALYQIRDFSYRVHDIHAFLIARNRREIAVRKLDKQTWQVVWPSARQENGQIEIDYGVEWNEPGPFNSQLNEHHAFINFAEILMYVPSRRNEEALIRFDGVPAGWQILTELVHRSKLRRPG